VEVLVERSSYQLFAESPILSGLALQKANNRLSLKTSFNPGVAVVL
jgi:hypothetical protein